MAAKKVRVLGVPARAMKPTQKHVPAIWGGILGTVNASDGKQTKYFDYDYDAAIEFAGITHDSDPRFYKFGGRYSYPGVDGPLRHSQKVLWILR